MNLRLSSRRVISSSFALGCLCSILMMTQVSAQNIKQTNIPYTYDSARHVRASNGAITVVLERSSGRYRIETGHSVPLLFSRGDGFTSFTNVRVGDVVFTNNDLRSATLPVGTTSMPSGVTSVQPERLTFRAMLGVRGDTVELLQEFVPSLDSTYAYVHIITTLINHSARRVRAGLVLMYDVFLDDTDMLDITVDGAPVTRERGWNGAEVPDRWTGRSPRSPIEVIGRLAHPLTDVPDRFVVGRWQYNGYLGAVSWNYSPSGLAMWDDAVCMQWDARDLGAGASRRIATDYGYRADLEAVLTCAVEQPSIDSALNVYVPDPLTATATLENAGLFDVASADVELVMPAGVTLAAGETALKTLGGPIAPGTTATATWKLHAATDTIVRLHDLTFRVIAPAVLAQSCVTSLRAPALPVYRAALRCPDTIVVQLGTDGRSYVPDPIPLRVVLDNSGTGPLEGMAATITLPQGLDAVGGIVYVPLTPAVLDPGQSARADFLLHALRRTRDTVFACPITVVAAHGITVHCMAYLRIPGATPLSPCVQQGSGTRGTEFHFALPVNDRGNGVSHNSLYIAASEQSAVHIARPGFAATDDVSVPAGGLVRFDLEDRIDDHVPDSVARLGVKVTSDRPISLFMGTMNASHSDASLVLPVHALGMHYVTAGYNFFDPEEFVLITGASDGTTVTITPSSVTSTFRPGGVPFQVQLDAEETFLIRAGLVGTAGGLTGTEVASDKPVAVISGARTGWIPVNNLPWYGYLNPHFHQLVATALCGTTYAVAPFRSRMNGATFKAVATEDATDVTVGMDAPVTLAHKGDAHEFVLTVPAMVRGTKPFVLTEFANSAAWDSDSNEYGDAMMIALTPVTRFQKCFEFPAGLDDRFDSSFVGIFAEDGAHHGVLLDGSVVPDTAFHLIPGGTIRHAVMPLTAGAHQLEAADVRGLGAVVYGFEYHDAFGFNAGFLIDPNGRVLGEEDVTGAPAFVLRDAYPNPFTTAASVTAEVPHSAVVRVELYDAAGRLVRTLLDGSLPAGTYLVPIDGSGLSSGMYAVVLMHPNGRSITHILHTR